MRTAIALVFCASLATGCTFYHSKQAILTATQTPSPEARFVTEEDSGLSLFGLFALSEPDHYSVLLERARRKHACSALHDAQLDFYTDYWFVLSFPISRITLICEPPTAAPASPPPAHPGAAKKPAPVTPATSTVDAAVAPPSPAAPAPSAAAP